jgi:hypothetical protein
LPEAIFDLLTKSEFRSLVVPVDFIEDLVEDTHPSATFGFVVREMLFGVRMAITGGRKARPFV